MKVKILAVFVLIGAVFLSQRAFASAERFPNKCKGIDNETSASPRWNHVNDITLDLYFEKGEAECSGKIRALSGTAKISAVFTLERKTSFGWSFEKSWDRSSSTNSLSFFETHAVPSGYTYCLSVTADVTRNGMTETVSTSVNAKY